MSAPSGYTALDFVGFTDKGTYSPIVKYMRNDLVHYGGNIMRCKVDDTMNVTPVEGANWELWVGSSANLVERVIAPLENNPADVAFGVGRQIIYDDWLWEVIAPIAIGDALIDYAVDPTNANIKKSAPVETQLLAVKAEADATDNMIAADTLTDQLAAKANSSDLAAVATSGAYSDLSGTPTLATVATSGSYNDLSNKPTLGTAAAKDSTNAVTTGSTDLVESGAVASEVATINTALATQALYFTSVACSATTGDFLTKSDASITANHVVAECTFANPAAITTDVTWTTANGSVTLNGTCASATTANLVLVKKGN